MTPNLDKVSRCERTVWKRDESGMWPGLCGAWGLKCPEHREAKVSNLDKVLKRVEELRERRYGSRTCSEACRAEEDLAELAPKLAEALKALVERHCTSTNWRQGKLLEYCTSCHDEGFPCEALREIESILMEEGGTALKCEKCGKEFQDKEFYRFCQKCDPVMGLLD